MINGGIKDNLLPASAEALVNFRLLPGDTIEDLVEYCGLVIHDPNVSVEVIPQAAWEATPLTSPRESAFSSLAEAVRQVYPGAEAAPYLVLGTTDSRHYAALSDQVLRFTPLLATSDDLSRMHGVNERVHVGALARMVQFYMHLFNVWAGGELPAAPKNSSEN